MIKKYYIGHFLKGLNDGGQSRNNAFRQYFVQNCAIIPSAYSRNPILRFIYLINIVRIFLFSKNNEIFILQGTFLLLFPIPILKIDCVRKIVFMLMQHLSERNSVTIDVNDLPYEQSIDLELVVDENLKVFQDKLYSLKKVNFLFASNEMGKYIKSKFNLNYNVIINGSSQLSDIYNTHKLHECFNSTETKFIYAGGLNKGRQIEALISKFSNRKEILILTGEWGEWITDYQLPSNIFYLGKFEEGYAHYLASKCDIGIIPYDETRFYYNICYPTKASFYITAGIPFLSTPLLELKNIFERNGIAFFVPFDNWHLFIGNFNKSKLIEIKHDINKTKHKFYWEELLGEYFKF
jgi:hypothetical protein